MMNEKLFRERYKKEQGIYLEWGNCVKSVVINQLMEKYNCVDTILKMPVVPRIKDEDSLVSKAFYRGKNYKNPYEDITDKVGVRFVVLTINQISEIKKIIEEVDGWSYSQDIDYEKQIHDTPELFVYQSVHYIVRNEKDINHNNVIIPKSTPCEVQIRTLLQHAYAELSHDTVYKKDIEIPSKVRRGLAKSMALIEATDDIFKEVYDLLSSENKFYTQYKNLVRKYCQFDEATDSLNDFIFMKYINMINERQITGEDVERYIKDKQYLCNKIQEKKQLFIVYRQYIVFLLYYFISNYRMQFLDKWPLPEELIIPLFTDLGIAIED